MRFSNRLWNYVATGIFVLTLANIFLTIRLFHSSQSPTIPVINCAIQQHRLDQQSSPVVNHQQTPAIPTLANPAPLDCDYGGIYSNYTAYSSSHIIFSQLDLRLGRWDKSRTYKIHDNVFVGDDYPAISEKFSVCIATQSSLERLGSLVQMAMHWSGGPISVGLFASGDEELYFLQLYLTYLRNCYPTLIAQMAFHLVYSRKFAPTKLRLNVNLEKDLPSYNDCEAPEAVLKKLVRKRKNITKAWRAAPYPQNHMRNVARKGCQTDYVFLVDVDIIPSQGMATDLDAFVKKIAKNLTTSKVAFVIPTFEVDIRVKFPKSKAEVLDLTQRKLARPFHQKIFIYNQFATNFSRWAMPATIKDEPNVTHISYNVTNFEFLYEPFYVARDDALTPEHDERFIGYGFTRNTQVFEMFVAGFQFQVLSPIFTCHPGLQNKKHALLREQQNNKNRRAFDGFKREVFARYNKDPLKMMQPPGKDQKKKNKQQQFKLSRLRGSR